MSESEIEEVVEGITKYIIRNMYRELGDNQKDINKLIGATYKIKKRLKDAINDAREEDRKNILSLYDEIQKLRESKDSIKLKYKSEYLIDILDRITSSKGEGILNYAKNLIRDMTKKEMFQIRLWSWD